MFSFDCLCSSGLHVLFFAILAAEGSNFFILFYLTKFGLVEAVGVFSSCALNLALLSLLYW